MAKLEVKVRNEKREKVVYENDFLPARKYREYLAMQADIEEKQLSETEALDIQLNFISSLFEGLTIDKMYDGMNMKEINNLIADVFVELIGGEAEKKETE
ncbi:MULTISPECIES: phage tail assembly chaperone G [Streptococcus]|uniref:phage tail assembly chaperone G n=1 Tax=Streptococcus TaxID=1301 RepID=UPI000EF6DF73|nr:hypothetical protein [Streptococcus iniae]RLV18999.1 hypothetical protein DIX77_04295 [Streptococcus iniae]